MVFSRSAILVCRLSFLSYFSSWVRLFLFRESMHQSRCSISSCCCLLSSVTILSISSLTLVKASNCAREAKRDSSGAPMAAAARTKTEVARRRRSFISLTEAICMKEFTVLSKASKDSSSFKILMVSSTATISVRRSFTRWSNSAPLSAHFVFRVARKVLSSSSWASVSSSSWKACACFSMSSAICWSSSAWSFLPAAISSSLAAFNMAYSSKSFFSLA
mmetsp:Transcript_38550/g.123931  ORF Transcript_38550/g.123931 Transcript_38550/m.123931 type:complete len:219 (-) Transcript_38550:30-686(-)